MNAGAGRVLFYVQHLLGIGHLRRAVTLANAMTHAGLEVTLVSGGMPLPSLRIDVAHYVQLSPASAADLSFKTLLDARGQPVDEAWRQDRCAQLLAAYREADPQVILVELFPFGRRQMRFELIPMLDAARLRESPPVVVSSVRDVLGGGKSDPTRQDQMLESFESHFDQVLVHGDPALVPFDKTFRHTGQLGNRLHYTGYAVEPVAVSKGPEMQGHQEVLVSVGGGAVGHRLLRTALQARPISQLSHLRWRLLAGVNASASDLEQLRLAAGSEDGVVVEHHRSDFPGLLAQCRLSISQGGYNTVMEVIQARAPAVIVPYAGGSETEQTLRTRLLAEHGWVEMVEEAELNAQSLALAVDRASVRTALPPAVRLDGALQSANIVANWARDHFR